MRISSRTLLALLAATLVLAGCGDDGGDGGSADAAAAGAEAAFPVTVQHKLGTAKIDAEPKRVVALDGPSADAVLALGVTPVGMYEMTYLEGGMGAWTRDALTRLGGKEPELLDTDRGFPLEKIAALRPDLIVGTNTYPLIADAYDKLSALAPVVAHVGAPGEDAWQEGVRSVGKALGRTEEAEKAIADAEAAVADAKKANAQFAGRSVTLFNYIATDGVYAISSNDDASMKFLTALGFSGVTPTLSRAPDPEGTHRAQLSAERYRDLDADVVIGTTPAAGALKQLERQGLFQRVPAVADDRYVTMDMAEAQAMAFPSVLSVPWAVRELTPRLADAVPAA